MSGVSAQVVRVGIAGRRGCGRATVTRVLRGAGVAVVGSAEPADLDVYVVAETLKPEDRRALAHSPRPVVVALNKADLAGFGGQGPVATAAAHCRRLSDFTGVPVYPLAGLAAVAALDDTVVDDEVLDALRALTTDPADLGSTDRFIDKAHQLPHPIRLRLLAQLDLFGIAHGVLALRAGADRAGLLAALRRASAVDGLLAGIDAAAAPVRYRWLIDAHAVALPASDDAVAARMAAAIEVVRAAGMAVDDDVTAAAHLRRAIVWQRYSRGPVSRLHRCCGADIARGSLRLWERAGGVAESLP
ncbi:hypothetical protein CG716_06055 [Mycolicibacterium sphagni]|uniref:Uncharacterized protein n=1 Tax=Mycolicibacterium sphagni TaxID=1786 RepID=A0A255DNT8_9MYCO|nr:hypothetical protein [Mycolicibacterium sphagni]OYN81107.1 hypothetical protein CG716_06055 [Mycolicibacterium sphagni]